MQTPTSETQVLQMAIASPMASPDSSHAVMVSPPSKTNDTTQLNHRETRQIQEVSGKLKIQKTGYRIVKKIVTKKQSRIDAKPSDNADFWDAIFSQKGILLFLLFAVLLGVGILALIAFDAIGLLFFLMLLSSFSAIILTLYAVIAEKDDYSEGTEWLTYLVALVVGIIDYVGFVFLSGKFL